MNLESQRDDFGLYKNNWPTSNDPFFIVLCGLFVVALSLHYSYCASWFLTRFTYYFAWETSEGNLVVGESVEEPML